MKKTFIFISIAAMFLAACSGNQNKEHNHQNGTHTHDDGSTHLNHEATDTVKQEEFTAPADTTHELNDNKQHSHDGHEHPHKH